MLIEVQEIEQTEAEREAECRRLMVNELMERTRDLYWRVEERGNVERTQAFVQFLKSSLEDVFNARY